MEHIAIMKKSWGFIPKILNGQKKIESRWYSTRHIPWDKIKKGEIVYFKNSGEPIKIKAEIKKVIQVGDLAPGRVRKILCEFGKDIGISDNLINNFCEEFKDKKYCILVFLKNPVQIKPFEINKSGFGMMSAWISTEDVSKIILPTH